MKKITLFVATAALLLWSCTNNEKIPTSCSLSAWNHDTIVFSIDSITDFVEKVCDKANNEYYVEPEDRIAVFDMDGTIACEKPFSMETYSGYYLTYKKIPMKGETIHDSIIEDSIFRMNKSSDYFINQFKYLTNTERLKNNYIPYADSSPRKLCELFYTPMVQLINYLQGNDFKVYIVSGSSQQFILGAIQSVDGLNIDPSHVIGSLETKDSVVYSKHQGPQFYPQKSKVFENSSRGKALNIYYRINKVPILAFGNTVHDFDMFALTASNKYPHTMCVLLNHNSDSYEADYKAYDSLHLIINEWTGWHGEDTATWNYHSFDTILTNRKWHKMNISEVFIKESLFVECIKPAPASAEL